MTFVAHGLIGASLQSQLVLTGGGSPTLTLASAIHGFVGGALPDVIDWVSCKLFGTERWSIYVKMHHGWSYWWLMLLFPAFFLHVKVFDPPFHDPTKPRDWWPRLWWAEVLAWLYSGFMLYVVFK